MFAHIEAKFHSMVKQKRHNRNEISFEEYHTYNKNRPFLENNNKIHYSSQMLNSTNKENINNYTKKYEQNVFNGYVKSPFIETKINPQKSFTKNSCNNDSSASMFKESISNSNSKHLYHNSNNNNNNVRNEVLLNEYKGKNYNIYLCIKSFPFLKNKNLNKTNSKRKLSLPKSIDKTSLKSIKKLNDESQSEPEFSGENIID